MDYIKIINWFWKEVPYRNGYRPLYGILFLAIVDGINKNMWRRNTPLEYDRIINKCRFTKEVYLNGRTWLMENGFIEFIPGKNNMQIASFSLGEAVGKLTGEPTGSLTGEPTGYEEENLPASLPVSLPIINKPKTDKFLKQNIDKQESDSPVSFSLKNFYCKDVVKDKKGIYDFIRKEKPEFLEPFTDAWNIWAQENDFSKIIKINDAREKNFKRRIKEPAFDFLEILKKAKASDFLNKAKWFSFDWLIKNDTNYLKVLEGNYDNKDTKSNSEISGNDNVNERLKKAWSNPRQMEEENAYAILNDEVVFPFSSHEFLTLWGKWKDYRIEKIGKKYNSVIEEQAALRSLSEKSNGNEHVAKNMIIEAMANGWKNFYEPDQKIKKREATGAEVSTSSILSRIDAMPGLV